MEERITSSKLLNLIQTEHMRLETTLARLTEAQMTQPGVMDEWSVKDILAHITFWEQHTLKAIHAAPRDEQPEDPPAEGEDVGTTVDRINARVFLANQDRPLPDVLADFQRSYRQIVDAVGSLSDEDLSDSSRLAQEIGYQVQQLIEEDTYGHYPLHDETIRAWLEQVAPDAA